VGLFPASGNKGILLRLASNRFRDHRAEWYIDASGGYRMMSKSSIL